MTNANLFKQTFGIYAEEFWSFDEKQMLDWLNADVSDRNVKDIISRQAAIDALKNVLVSEELEYAIPALEKLPSAQPDRKRGKWIVYYECPKCGEITKDFTEYCPFCNTDMRGEEDE